MLKWIELAGVTYLVSHSTPVKTNFQNQNWKFLGHIISNQGLKADTIKTKALLDMQLPTNVSEMHLFIGLTNQFSKFIPCSAGLMKPLTELLNSKRTFQWRPNQTNHLLKSERNWRHLQPLHYMILQLIQRCQHYAQIEKEVLAFTWACERFSMYLLRKSLVLKTDHKPLLSLLSAKNLDSLLPHIL